MTETREQQIERLKKNTRTIYADRPKEDQEFLKEIGPAHCEYLTSEVITHGHESVVWRALGTGSTFYGCGIYRIRADYQPEPTYVDLPIKTQYDSAGVLWLGCVRIEAILAIYNVLPHPFTHLHCLPSLPGFAGFYDGTQRIPLDFAAEYVGKGKKVVAKFEVKP